MIRKASVLSIVIALIFIVNCRTSYALSIVPVNSFTDWYEQEQLGQFSFSGASTSVTTDSEGNLSKTYSNAVGILSNINISKMEGQASSGLGMNLGFFGENRVHVNIGVEEYNNNSTIYYYIRLRDSDNNFIQDLAYGRFGGRDEPIIGKNITVGFVRVGNEIWLYAEGYSIVKWCPFEQMTTGQDFVWLWAWANQGTDGSVTTTFSNVRIIYP